MKLSRLHKKDKIENCPKWCCLDNCPVCRLIKKSLAEDYEFSLEEWERAFAEAEAENRLV